MKTLVLIFMTFVVLFGGDVSIKELNKIKNKNIKVILLNKNQLNAFLAKNSKNKVERLPKTTKAVEHKTKKSNCFGSKEKVFYSLDKLSLYKIVNKALNNFYIINKKCIGSAIIQKSKKYKQLDAIAIKDVFSKNFSKADLEQFREDLR